MAYFPLFFDLKGKKVLVAGAGNTASRRICVLHKYGAELTVITKESSAEVQKLADNGQIRLISEAYENGRKQILEESFFLVLTATGDAEADQLAEEDGRRMGAFVNVAGEKEHSDFYFPGIAGVGEVTAGVIAGGTNHRLAKQMTERVQKCLEGGMEVTDKSS